MTDKLSSIIESLEEDDLEALYQELHKRGFRPKKRNFTFGGESFALSDLPLFQEMFNLEAKSSGQGIFFEVESIAEVIWSVFLQFEDGRVAHFESEDDRLDRLVISFPGKWESDSFIRSFLMLAKSLISKM